MKKLFIVAVLLIACMAGLGFYQGWIHLSANSTDQNASATITVDQVKIRADEGKAKDKIGELGQKTKEKTGR
jgi:hypothetical protein